ncbi:MAG: SUMF1/EgtB/PvdO family nonheme iron enzyme [Candidatus Promineofilum sp.]|nr:SUMF1/EgtB/PvdO family nonheme iron enzyme [Promineifilum sp.]
MSRTVIVFLKILSIILWLFTALILIISLVAGMSGVDIPWLGPLESLIGVIITGIGGLIAWLTARRGERSAMQQTITHNQGAAAQGEKSTAVNVGPGHRGSIVIAEVVQQITGPIAAATDADSLDRIDHRLMQYLEWLRERTGTIELRGVSHAGKQVALELERVYVPLEATAASVVDEPEWASSLEQRNRRGVGIPHSEPLEITLDRVLTQGRQLVITGGPGCGKTTVLRHVAWVLATSFVTDDPAFAERRLGLIDELPLPIYVPLSAFAEHLRALDQMQRQGNRVAAQEFRLDYFIPGYLVENAATHGLPEDFFTQLLDRGDQIILLLDGLDEVPNEAERQRVREKVEQLVAGRRDKMRVVVTCRTAAYHDQTALDRRFREVRVKPLEDSHVAALVTHAYEDVYRLDPTRREKKTAELLNGIRRLEADRRDRFGDGAERLITSPLLVRMLIIVHQREGSNLPEQRAELYWKATEVMLMPDYSLDEEVADRIGRLIGGRKELHRDLSQHLAFHMHSRGEQQGREIDEDGLRAVLSTDVRFAPFIDDYIALTRLRGTLLEELLGTYRFVHLAFQEFLAARYLAEVERDIGQIAAFLEAGPVLDSWWREAALLVPGYLAVTSEASALSLLQRLAGVDAGAPAWSHAAAPDVQLAATEIAAVAIMEWATDKADLRRAVAHRLAALLTDESLAAPNPLRGLAGVALGRLGDPRADVNCPIPFTVPIPAGPFIMGSKKGKGKDEDELAYEDKEPRHEVTLPAYKIGKYPVTVAQYRRFVEEGKGYETARYWTPAGWEQRRKEGWAAPRWWDDPQWTVDNHPVVGVSWYEAVAYCNWLNVIKPRDRGFFRLPDEAMWEKAARGTDGRRWPWGNDWDPTKLNSGDGGIGRTSAVGIFPTGRIPEYGVYDAAGNVLEWCSSPGYREAKYPLTLRSYQEDLKLSVETRALRGGSWGNLDQNARAAYRDYGNPHDRYLSIGFRVVELLSILTSEF